VIGRDCCYIEEEMDVEFVLFHDFRNKSVILITLYEFLIVNKGGDPGFEYPLQLELNKKYMLLYTRIYEGWNFNSGNYLFTTDTK